MSLTYETTRVRGKDIPVPTLQFNGKAVVALGKWLKIASFRDEELVEGELVSDANEFIATLKQVGIKADVVTFPQRIDEPTPKFDLPYELDNVAAASTSNFEHWWSGLPQEARKNARRAEKKGVVVRKCDLDDNFIKGIKSIYDESPVRQGRKFWHYGKPLERVRLENSTYPDRSDFIGAYLGDELIGFMKWTYVDKVARIMQILAKSSYYDMRPMNVMIAKAVEICQQRGMDYLIYSKFTFGNKANSQLTEFKRRNGFIKMEFPRYAVPLTTMGRFAIWTGLHRGLIGMLPPALVDKLWSARAAATRLIFARTPRRSTTGGAVGR